MGGQQPIQPSFPKESIPIKAPSGENVTQPPAMSKGKARRRPRTQRMRNKQVTNKDEENGILLLGPSVAATQTPPAASSSSSGIDLQQQQPIRRRSAPSSNNNNNNREPKSQRRRRKAKEVNKRQDEGLIPAQVGGRLAVAEESPQQQNRNYQTLQQQQQREKRNQPYPLQAPIIAVVAKQDDEYDTARSDRPAPPFKPSSERPQSCEDNLSNTIGASAETLRRSKFLYSASQDH